MRKFIVFLICFAVLFSLLPLSHAVQTDDILDSLVRISARPDFAFRYDLSNSESGEAAPIKEDYYLSAYKVTNAQYLAFIQDTGTKAPSYWSNNTYPEAKADHPVLNVSYSNAVKYCQWLSDQYEDWNFRLPTEAEWENAAMGSYYGDTSVKYPHGKKSPSYDADTGVLTTSFNYNGVIAAKLFEDYGSDYVVNYIKGDFAGTSETLGACISISTNGGVSNWANHGSTATKGYFLQTDLYAAISADGGYTTPVGSYPPNSLGLYDMAGNSWDLTSSLIVAENGLEAGETCYAVRGGSWYATARSCTFYYRGEGRKDSPSATVGFRLAADYTGTDDDQLQTPSSFTACSISTTELENFQYWLYTPQNPTENMPLIVYLHGGSGKGSDLSLLTSVDGFPKYLQEGQFGNLRAYVIMPQLPSDQTGWTSVGPSLMTLINTTVNTYGLDADNISLTGHSMGGTGTWSVTLSYPATFARIAPLSGSIKNNTVNINKLKNVPVRAFVGSADTIVDPSTSQNFIASLKAAGGEAQITTFADATHFDVPALTYLDEEIGLLNWLIDARFAACNTAGQIVSCATLEDAMAQGDYVRLLQDAETDTVLVADLCLDLNGYSLTGTIACGNYSIYGMDSTTDGYTCQKIGYFNCLDENGTAIVPIRHFNSSITGSVRRYLTIRNEYGYSFHRFFLGITHMTLKPTTDGVGYKAVFYGDEAVVGEIESFGYKLQLDGFEPMTVAMKQGGFASGEMVSLRIENFDVAQFGETSLQAVVVLEFADGNVVESQQHSMTLRGLFETLNANAAILSAQQLNAVSAMIEKYPIIRSWDVENLI